ncbi:hypothetical protein CG433_06130 [Pantoea ananatis]|uniref:hypothetical protein n=2 Tax=Pantoea ananas TaxID=553 RepID=UPI000CF47D01|nr:hypothetical protein [Pantoea ananatis]PQK96365.1 hypothetical protein CG433_06130 [Pantoea ananatis]
MLSKTGFTHSDLLCWQSDYAGGSLNMNGTVIRDTYKITQNEINIAVKETEKGEDHVLLCSLSVKKGMLDDYVKKMPDLLPGEDSFMTDDINLLKLSTEDISKILLCDMLERGALVIHTIDELRSEAKVIQEEYWNEVEDIYYRKAAR